MLVTTDVVRPYPNIPHDLDLKSLSKGLNETDICKVPTIEFICKLKNVCMQVSETLIGTNFEPH